MQVVTCHSVCRLPFVRRQMALYNGPVSLAVYIPYPHSTPEADACRVRVLAYMRTTPNKLSNADDGVAPFAMSFLYAVAPSPILSCDLSEATTGFEEPRRNHTLWQKLYASATAVDFYHGEYPVGAMRQLAKNAVRGSQSSGAATHRCTTCSTATGDLRGGVLCRSRRARFCTWQMQTLCSQQTWPRSCAAARVGSFWRACAEHGSRTARGRRWLCPLLSACGWLAASRGAAARRRSLKSHLTQTAGCTWTMMCR